MRTSPPSAGRLQLLGFDERHASEVASWATTAAEALAWCSHDGHPVPAEQVAAWGDEPGCSAFALVDGPELVGYGELWVEGEEVELARLIVAPAARRRGFGVALTRALLVRARSASDDVFLRIRPENDVARRVYRRAGFQRVAPEVEQEWNAQQPVDYVWMRAPAPRSPSRDDCDGADRVGRRHEPGWRPTDLRPPP